MDFFAKRTQLAAAIASSIEALAAGDAAAALAGVRALVDDAEFSGGKPEEAKALVDHCLCQAVDGTLDGGGAAALHRALDLTVLFAAEGVVDLPCPLNILNDVLSAQTIEECSETFAYLESKKASLFEKGFFAEHKKKNAKVALLRLCNAMVKRLSKSNDTVFRGRILMFLATVLSISDRSGVNLRGVFNTDNATEFDEAGAAQPDAADGADLEFYKKFWALQKLFVQRELIHQPVHWAQLTEGVPLILSAFASQGQMDDADGGDDGKKKAKKSRRGSKGGSPRPAAADAAGTPRASAAAAATSNESYFAKFLTSSHLMSLELRDPHFRRHILVQVRRPASPPPVAQDTERSAGRRDSQLLIFFQHLQQLPSVGDPKRLAPKQRTIIDGFVTKTEALLEKIAPRGHRFLRGAQHILDREEHWMGWKDRGDGAERCPSLSVRLFLKTTPPSDKKPVKTYVDVEGGSTVAGLKSKVADKLGIPAAEQRLSLGKQQLEDAKLVCDYAIPSKSIVQVGRAEPQPELPPMRKGRAAAGGAAGGKRVKLGTEELTRLWNCGSTELGELTESSVPTLARHLEPAVEQMQENAAMTEEQKSEIDPDDLYKNDKLFVWRALRLMAKSDVKAFERLTGGEDMDAVLSDRQSAEGGDDMDT